MGSAPLALDVAAQSSSPQAAPRPAVSVCVPTYNGEAYLAECLDSVLAQTFTDFEVLVVDDCSADRSVAIAEAYAARDPRVRVIRNARNLGLVGNWNRCVELSAGEWVKFVFQDDLIAPTCLARMLAVAQDGWVLVSCARDFAFAPETSASDQDFYWWHHRFLADVLTGTMSAEQFSLLVLDHPDNNLLGEPTAVLFHRSAVDRFGAFNDLIVQDVDAEYWARVGTAVGVAHLGDVLATFRVHGTSTTSRNVRTRQVRKAIDRVVTRHEVAFSPAYAALRAVCARMRPDRDLAREFWDVAYDVLVGDRAATLLANAGGRGRDELTRLYTAYPRLRIPLRRRARIGLSRYLSGSGGVPRAYRAAKQIAGRVVGRPAGRA